MEKIYKSFGANNVLTEVNFSLGAGEICALLGENGAGKSTLMNILGGVLTADSGKIVLDGEEKNFLNPVDSLDAGIGFIHQELNLINDLSIYENMFITHLPKKGAFLDAKLMQEKTAELFRRMNIDLDPCTMVRDLDASYKQIVEIGRALLQEASIIIMDEPTTSLTEPEIERVFAMMRTLKEQGVSIIFISHKLNEVMAICDRYTVLRDGNMVAQGAVKDTDQRQLAAQGLYAVSLAQPLYGDSFPAQMEAAARRSLTAVIAFLPKEAVAQAAWQACTGAMDVETALLPLL